MSNRSVFTGSVLLLLVAGLEVWLAYSGSPLTIGTYQVPAMMSWFGAAVFGLFGLLTLRGAHG